MHPTILRFLILPLAILAPLAATASHPPDSDERWSDRFHLNGALPGIRAVALVGSDVYVSSSVKSNELETSGVSKWDGSQWSGLGSGLPQGTVINAFAVIGTDLYAGGSFTEIGGVAAMRIAKWNGETWSPLGAGLDADVRALTVFNGELYAGGNFQKSGNTTMKGIARWNGESWSAVGDSVPASVGSFASIGSKLFVVAGSTVMQWDGVNWTALGSTANDGYAVSVAAVGTELYFGGVLSDGSVEYFSVVARWDGDEWIRLEPPSQDPMFAVYQLAEFDGTLHAIENGASEFSPVYDARLWSWDGEQWNLVEDRFDDRIMTMLPHGSDLYVAGWFQGAGDAASSVARWDGADWHSVGDNGGLAPTDTVYASVVHKGKLYIGGHFPTAGALVANSIAQWTGSRWASVGGGVDGRVYALASDGDDLYVGGVFGSAGGVEAGSIAKWDGSVWSPLGDGIEGWVNAIVIDGNDVYAAGDFDIAGGKPASSIAKWDGVEWTDLGGGVSDHVNALAIGPDGLYVGGEFSWAGEDGNYEYRHIARWDGTAWHTVGDVWEGAIVSDLAVIGEDVYAAGRRFHVDETETAGVARWDGQQWHVIPGKLDGLGDVVSLAVDGTDLYAGGGMHIEGTSPGIAKWDGASWSGFGSGHDGAALTVSVLDGNLYVGGLIREAGGKHSFAFGKFRFAEPFEVCGDVTGDEVLSASDALGVLQAAVGQSACELVVCDFTGDGQLGATDALGTLRAAVGLDVVGMCAESAAP